MTVTDDDRSLGVEALLDVDHPIKVATSEWARATLDPTGMVDRDRESTFDAEAWRACAERGIQGLMVAPEHGGRGAGVVETLLVLEGLGHGCRDNGLVFGLTSQIWSTQTALTRFGTPEQQARWLPPLVDGSQLGAFAITEPGSGSDTYSLTSTAEAVDDGAAYRLDGHKAWLTLGSRCDLVIVFAKTRPEAGRWGISCFVVPTDLPGVELDGNREKMGMRTTPFGDIRLDGVVVPADHRLGPEGAGASIFASAMEAERAYVLAGQIGMMERQLDDTVAYARTRTQFDEPIGRFQAVSHRIADMKLRHETARLLMYKAALLEERERDVMLAAALAKLHASEAAVDSGLDATRVHGAVGYVSEFEVERDLRDAVGGLIYSGTSDIQRNIIARLLGVG